MTNNKILLSDRVILSPSRQAVLELIKSIQTA